MVNWGSGMPGIYKTHSRVSASWKELVDKEAGILVHQLLVHHWLGSASVSVNSLVLPACLVHRSCSKEKNTERQRVVGSGGKLTPTDRDDAGLHG